MMSTVFGKSSTGQNKMKGSPTIYDKECKITPKMVEAKEYNPAQWKGFSWRVSYIKRKDCSVNLKIVHILFFWCCIAFIQVLITCLYLMVGPLSCTCKNGKEETFWSTVDCFNHVKRKHASMQGRSSSKKVSCIEIFTLIEFDSNGLHDGLHHLMNVSSLNTSKGSKEHIYLGNSTTICCIRSYSRVWGWGTGCCKHREWGHREWGHWGWGA